MGAYSIKAAGPEAGLGLPRRVAKRPMFEEAGSGHRFPGTPQVEEGHPRQVYVNRQPGARDFTQDPPKGFQIVNIEFSGKLDNLGT